MFKKLFLALAVVAAVLYGVAFVVAIDPEERRPGTRLSGEYTDSFNTQWQQLSPQERVWIQTETWYGIPHSVTTISIVDGNTLYIPCGWCEGKRWPQNIARDPKVVVKADGALYAFTAVQVSDPSEKQRVSGILNRDLGAVEFYRMEPRTINSH